MSKAVRFEKYGDVDVLTVVEMPRPVPGPGQVLVRVEVAGINPGEAGIRTGALHELFPATFPSGQGSDFAGVVVEAGGGFAVGDQVLGFTNKRGSHAEFVVAEADELIARPAGVPVDVAGSLFVAGSTAVAVVRAVSAGEGDVVVVSGAAGGVGAIASQLANNAGARVIGLASEANHAWLAEHGVTPVAYGDGVAERIRDAAGRVDAFIDTFGNGYLDLALELGVSPERTATIIDFAGAARLGTKTAGNADAATADTLVELTGLIAKGLLDIPIAATYPLAEVRAAFRALERRHTRGKIVLKP